MLTRHVQLFFIAIFLALPSAAAAQKVRMSYAGTTGFNVPFWMAREAGFLRKQGFNEELLLISGGSTNMQALVAGELQFVNAAGSAPILAVLGGADVAMIAASYNFMPYGLVVGRDIRSPSDLKGRTIAISRLGGITEVAARLAFEKLGLGPRDMTIIQAGPDAPRIAAVESGAVAATVLAPPGLFAATSSGLRMLADLGDLGIKYPTSVIVTSRAYLAQNRAAAKRFLMAFVEALHLYKQRRALAIEVMQKYTRLGDPDLLSKTYDYFVKNTSLVPLVDAAAVAVALPAGKEKEKRMSDFFDNSLIEELVREGFVDRTAKAIR